MLRMLSKIRLLAFMVLVAGTLSSTPASAGGSCDYGPCDSCDTDAGRCYDGPDGTCSYGGCEFWGFCGGTEGPAGTVCICAPCT